MINDRLNLLNKAKVGSRKIWMTVYGFKSASEYPIIQKDWNSDHKRQNESINENNINRNSSNFFVWFKKWGLR
jgi:hypothetical protein